jgi:hypothetical protein
MVCIPYKSRHIKNKIFVLFLLSYYLSETRVEANLSYHPEIINFDDFPILKGHNSSSESATTMNIKLDLYLMINNTFANVEKYVLRQYKTIIRKESIFKGHNS